MNKNIYRQGNTLTIGVDATDAEVQAFAADPAITDISLAVGLNATRPALTEAGLESLARWTHLERLSLSGSAATDRTLAKLTSLKRLRVLILMETHVSAKGLTELKKLPQLRELWLDGIPLTDEATVPLADLTQLRILRFNRAPITDAGFAHLANLKQLEDLQLGESMVTDKILPIIGAMTRLKTLDLRASVTGAGLRALQGLSELRWLALGKTVDDAGIAALRPLKKLESLYLDGARITDSSLPGLQTFFHLKTLDLSNTAVTDKGIDSLKILPALTDLRLDGTDITDRALDSFGMPNLSSRQKLERLSLENTAITPGAIARIHRLQPQLKLEGLSREQEVMAWLSEAPFDNSEKLRAPQEFSYDDWFKRGREIYYVEETLCDLVQKPVIPVLSKAHAAYALGWIGTHGAKNTLQTLLRALMDPENRVRMEVVSALGRLGDSSVLEPLRILAMNRKEDRNVRGNAYVALGNLGIRSAEATLQSGINDPDPFVAKCAKEGVRLLK